MAYLNIDSKYDSFIHVTIKFNSKDYSISIFFRNIQFKNFFNNLVSRKIQFKNWFKNLKGWLPIAKLKPLVERYSCQPMRSLDTSNNLSVGPSCMWRTWNSWLCYLVSNAAGRRAGWEEQRDREKQGERGRAGEEQWKGRGKLLNLVI